MKLTVLTENSAGSIFQAEHGLSYLIETDGEKILFDTGHSDIFLKNALRLGINMIKDVNTIVLSHGHWDHGDGLSNLHGKRLIAHPGVFSKRYRKRDHSYLGLNLDQQEAEKRFALHLTKSPFQITANLWFLGEIPRLNNFEAQSTTFALDNGEDDFIPDDSALVARTGNQLVVISGCAHSGICNICEYAKKVTGIAGIKTVIGGFHLKDQGGQTQKTLDYFVLNNIQNILPSHCTAPEAKTYFRQKLNFPEVKTGMSFEF